MSNDRWKGVRSELDPFITQWLADPEFRAHLEQSIRERLRLDLRVRALLVEAGVDPDDPEVHDYLATPMGLADFGRRFDALVAAKRAGLPIPEN